MSVSNIMSAMSNINVENFLSSAMQNVNSMSSSLDATMKKISSGDEMSQQDMLKLQYDLGKYQSYMEMLSSTISSIQDQVKEMASSIR